MRVKSIVLPFMAGCLLLALGSCGSKDEVTSGESIVSSEVTSSATSSSNNSSSQSGTVLHSLDEICYHLSSLGFIDISKKSEKRADLVGAQKGYGFEVCEIYQYESDCPENLEIYGVSFPYNARNGHYGLYINNKFTGDKSVFENTFKTINIQ